MRRRSLSRLGETEMDEVAEQILEKVDRAARKALAAASA